MIYIIFLTRKTKIIIFVFTHMCDKLLGCEKSPKDIYIGLRTITQTRDMLHLNSKSY
jgi:hypothetical protein